MRTGQDHPTETAAFPGQVLAPGLFLKAEQASVGQREGRVMLENLALARHSLSSSL